MEYPLPFLIPSVRHFFFKTFYQNIKLETFLKQITLVVNNYEKACKEYSDNSLYLLINATDKSDKTTTYKVPLKIEENCNK